MRLFSVTFKHRVLNAKQGPEQSIWVARLRDLKTFFAYYIPQFSADFGILFFAAEVET